MDERYLDLLAEECAEVIQAIMKIKRFGMHDRYPNGKTGQYVLLEEIADVSTILDLMGFTHQEKRCIDERKLDKIKKLQIYGPDGSYFKDREHKDKPNEH